MTRSSLRNHNTGAGGQGPAGAETQVSFGRGSTHTSSSSSSSSSTNENKWAKNGFGQGVQRQQTGKFSKEESEIVRKAVEDFCAVKQISVARLCSECDHKAELKGAWMEIAKRLPHRSVQSVYRHGLRQLHPFKRGAWSEDECETLVGLVTRMGKKWAAIQQKLNRSADSCRDKYREMNEDYIRGRWKETETETLKKLIREHLNADPKADIKGLGKMVEAEGITIPWSVISKRMGKRSRLSCFKKWQKMTGIFSPSDQQQHQHKPNAKDTAATTRGYSASAGQDMTGTATHPTHSGTRTKIKSEPLLTHAAPTAGAAAALAATVSINNPIRQTAAAAAGVSAQASSGTAFSSSPDIDLYLLTELAALGATRASEVDWEGIRLDNPQERWNVMFEEWQSGGDIDESLLVLPLSEMAQTILEQKTSAQRAAETVEAVNLPEV